MLLKINGFLRKSNYLFQPRRFFNSFGRIAKFGYGALQKECIDSHADNQQFETPQDKKLRNILHRFNHSLISFSFGYGSGVFLQSGYKGSNPQVDLIYVVDDPKTFHEKNSSKNPDHYSGLLRWGGVSTVCWAQELGAGVYFNPYVPFIDATNDKTMVKYGVTSTTNALRDICEWSSFYLAGRLQKPVKHLNGVGILQKANQYNLDSALNLAIIYLASAKKSNTVSERDLFETIALLSYMGDPRMWIGGENPNKVKNIVSKQLLDFRKLYHVSIEKAKKKSFLKQKDQSYEFSLDVSKKSSILSNLPLQFRSRLIKQYDLRKQNYNGQALSAESTILSLASSSSLHKKLSMAVQSTIAAPALVQTVKGIFTAGITKSIKYAWEKRKKSMKS